MSRIMITAYLKPNVLFVLIDSLRPDKLFEKQKKVLYPTIDNLVKNGVYFSNAVTTNHYTAQVMQTIFTSQFPVGNKLDDKLYTKINSKDFSMISHLRNNGYSIFGTVQEDVFLHGLSETFDNDDVQFKSSDNLYNGLAERILNNIDSMDNPWFYYIHLEDLHTPCVVPKEFEYLKFSERYDKNISEIDLLFDKILKKINLDETLIIITSDHGEYVSPIKGSLGEQSTPKTKIKNSIKKFLPKKELSKIHYTKQKLIGKYHAVKASSPHEKRLLSGKRHGKMNDLFEDILRIPLIFVGYGINPHFPITKQVCNIDIFPTIMDIIGISDIDRKLDGRSLLPLIADNDFNEIPIYLTSSPILQGLFRNVTLEDMIFLVGIRTPNFKYFRNADDSSKNVHLYDLKNDPFENKNICGEKLEIVNEMESLITKIQKDSQPLLTEETFLDMDEIKKVQESLKKLGYI